MVISALEGYAPLFEMLELKEEEVRSKAAMTLAILGKLPQRRHPLAGHLANWGDL